MSAPLPLLLGGTELIGWRIDASQFAATWDSGEGSYRFGGRWSGQGTRAVYCALDPSTTILEVAVHRSFKRLDTVAHTLTSLRVLDPDDVYVVRAETLPNSNWLRPGIPSAGQQDYGTSLLGDHPFVLVPSVISPNSWNLIFIAANAVGRYTVRAQEAFALDTRLHPPTP